MKKSLIKLGVWLLVVELFSICLFSIGGTSAYFNDDEIAEQNILSAGSLDFSLNTPGDFSLNFTSTTPSVRNMSLVNDGSLPFEYTIEVASGLEGMLCPDLILTAKLDGVTYYSSDLYHFNFYPPVPISGSQDDWTFEISFAGGTGQEGESCQFNLFFKGWQEGATDYNSAGFKDEEEVFNRVSLRENGSSVSAPDVVLNEFLPHPSGSEECSLQGLDGEWVEIYNNGGSQLDLANWYVSDDSGHKIYITPSSTMDNSTIIGAKGSGSEWLVVFLDDCILNNDGDTVSLFDNGDTLIDSYSYTGLVPENKSYARIPDGSGAWQDPIPTPGRPNIPDTEIEAETDGSLIAPSGLSETPTAEEPFTDTGADTGLDNSTTTTDIGPVQTTTDEIIEAENGKESGEEKGDEAPDIKALDNADVITGQAGDEAEDEEDSPEVQDEQLEKDSPLSEEDDSKDTDDTNLSSGDVGDIDDSGSEAADDGPASAPAEEKDVPDLLEGLVDIIKVPPVVEIVPVIEALPLPSEETSE